MPVKSTGSRYSPSTVKRPWLPRFVVTVKLSPVRSPDDLARLVSIRAPSVPSWAKRASDASPCQSKSKTRAASAGSIVFRNWVPPGWARISGKRRNSVASTPGTLRTTCSEAAGKGSKLSVWRIRSPWTTRSMAPVNDSLSPAAKIATKVTSPTPIISAAAVAAVRAGLRVALARARRPVVPAAASMGAPIALASGRTTKRASIPTPMNTSTAPMARTTARRWRPGRRRARRRRAGCRRTTRMPARYGAMRLKRPGGRVAPSWTAAIGGTRVARSAGPTEAITVTTTPISSATMTVRGRISMPGGGQAESDGVEEGLDALREPDARRRGR